MPRVLCIAILGFLGGCSSDFLPFSGGQLQGVEKPLPVSWIDVASKDVVQLETQGESPYSVNLWVIGKETHLYVFAGSNRATWIEHIESNPNVRLKIGEDIYPLQAQQVTDVEEFAGFADAWEEKYGRRPQNENVDETYLMRLVPRS